MVGGGEVGNEPLGVLQLELGASWVTVVSPKGDVG